MDYAINILEEERKALVLELKQGRKERLADLQALDKALGWLRLLNERQVDTVSRYSFDALPDTKGYGMSFYRLMIDNETDDTDCWVEYVKSDGSHYELLPGDFICTKK